jgi:hypothetical protein
MKIMNRIAGATLVGLTLLTSGCATLGLGSVIQPPRFSQANDRETQLLFAAPSPNRPLGGATLRIWARVQNPNAFGLRLAALTGNVFLENQRAAAVDFPLGLPLAASADTIIPLDIQISFSELPGLAGVAQRILTQNRVAYRLDGTLSVDAAPFGQPSFGPSTWLQGESRVVR